MRHIKQRNETDCGVAAAAMAAGVGYRRAAELAPPGAALRGLFVPGALELLAGLTGQPWKARRPSPYRPVGEMARALGSGSALLIVRRKGDEYGHWVAWDGALVYDPEHAKPRRLAAYPRRHWLLIRVVAPDGP
jgi:hypothetical protein